MYSRFTGQPKVIHPDSPAGRTFRWDPTEIPHPASPAGRCFDWSILAAPHPGSPAGRNFDWHWSAVWPPACPGDSSPLGSFGPIGDHRPRTNWTAYIQSLDLGVPANCGALWSKLFDGPLPPNAQPSSLSDGDVATALAAQHGRFTLESKLAATDFWKRYRAEFPAVNGKPVWNARTQGIWKMLSEKFASGLRGHVVAYVDSIEVINAFNRGEPPILSNELRAIRARMSQNRNITRVTFQDIWTQTRTQELSLPVLDETFRFH